MRIVALIAMISFAALQTFAQLGPGGVSVESGGNSNNKVWLDAGSISASDNSALSSWQDESHSVNDNSATQGTASLQPTYRSDPSVSINGRPIVRFGGGKQFNFVSLPDINTAGPYTERTTFVVIRTGSDVTTRQMLYEQGGTVRGLNIFIVGGQLHMGGYDLANDADATPTWAFVSTTAAVAANTTYVVTHVFDGPTGATTGEIRGYLNGSAFAAAATGVGSLWSHPDVPGLGAINQDSYNETGPLNNPADPQAFLGDVAEFIAYDEILNPAERIIVENYLGAKYSANSITNDYFEHQLNYGSEVIGIGQATGAAERYNTSQSRNLFQIAANTADFNNDEYFLIGHNEGATAAWITTNAPDSGMAVKRLAREWQASHTGDLDSITFTIDSTDFPTKSTDYTKYVLIVDKSGGILPDFLNEATEVYEFDYLSAAQFEVSVLIPDSAFVTIGIVKPEVQFAASTNFGFEAAVNTADSVEVELNYIPIGSVNIDYSYAPNTALNPGDYTVASATGMLTFPAGSDTAFLPFNIVGDATAEGTEDFSVSLLVGTGNTPGLSIGSTNIHTYTIYDDDNPPKIGFSTTTSAQGEAAGAVTIPVVRSGTTTNAVACNYRLRSAGGSGTATDGSDYVFATGSLSFPIGATLASIPLTITEDTQVENNETVILELFAISGGASFLPGGREHTLTIVDNDPDPEVLFTLTSDNNGENIGAPFIEVRLTQVSDKTITVQYQIDVASTATSITDYFLNSLATLTFAPGDSTKSIPLIVVNDGVAEGPETVILNLLNNASLTNATLGTNTTFTYSIEDFTYTDFEYEGTAGVGQRNDNIFFLEAEALTGAHSSLVNSWTDQSGNIYHAIKGVGAQQPALQVTSNLLNGKKVLRFDGTNDELTIPINNDINTSTFDSKFIFVAFRTGADVTTRQVLYEQGGGTRGLSIYVEAGEIHFHAWNRNNDDGGATTPWGGSGVNAVHLASTGSQVGINTAYIATMAFDFTATNKFEGFLDGTSVATPFTANVGRLFSHGDPGGIGGIEGGTYFPDGTAAGSNFGGDIAEVIHYSNAPINTTRRRLIENYLGSKYGITVANNYYNHAGTHSYRTVGIGRISSSDMHQSAESDDVLRVSNSADLDDAEFLMTGHDNAGLAYTATDVPFALAQRLSQVWRVTETGDVGTVTIRIDTAAFPARPSGFYGYSLLIDADGVFATGATVYALETDAGSVLKAENVVLADGDHITVSVSGHISVQTGDYNDPTTWLSGRVPALGETAIVDATHTVSLNQDHGVGTITVNPTGTLDIGSNTLDIDIGNLTVDGSIDAATGTINMVGTAAQTISGNNTFNNLTINNAAGVSVISGTQELRGTLTLSNGLFNTNDALVLYSDASGTGNIAEITAGSITGDITMQRYISTTSAGWRNMASCVSGTQLYDWNDDIVTTGFPGSNYPGWGWINVYSYDESALGDKNEGFVAPSNISDGVAVGTGFMNYVSGGPYVLDVTGPVTTGTHNFSLDYTDDPAQLATEDGWNLVGNPYPSDIDWDAPGWLSNNVNDAIYVWDPQAAQYTTYVAGAGTNGGSQHIASSQAFWVQTSGAGPTLSCTEAVKSNTQVRYFKSAGTPTPKLKLRVEGSGYADEAVVRFPDDATEAFDPQYDARKLASYDPAAPTLSTISNEGSDFSINSMEPLIADRTVPLRLLVGTTGSYTIARLENELDVSYLLLEDRLTGNFADLLLDSTYTFDIEDTTAGPRFILHFGAPELLAVSLSEFTAQPENETVLLNWTTATETNNIHFVVQRSRDGLRFEPLARVDGAGTTNSPTYYSTVDRFPYQGRSFYRLISVDNDGDEDHSGLVSVNFSAVSSWELQLYPNPSSGKVTIRFKNAADEASIVVLDASTNKRLDRSLSATNGEFSTQLNLEALPAGIYFIQLIAGGEIHTQKLLLY